MTRQHRDIPTYKDLCPGDPPCLDEKAAANNFLGKTLKEAEALFHENCMYYANDLTWMGRVGFEYYLQAFQDYLTSDASLGDSGVESVVDLAFHCRHKQRELGAAKSLVLECLDYLIANFDKFDLEDTVQPTLKDMLTEAYGDQKSRAQTEAAWVEFGGNPDEMEELWQYSESLLTNDQIAEEEPGLTTLERWKKLRKSIADS